MIDLNKIKPGDLVYVVEKDEYGIAVDVLGRVLICALQDRCVLTSPLFYGCEHDIDTMIEHFIYETRSGTEVDLAADFIEDIYETKEEANAAYREQKE